MNSTIDMAAKLIVRRHPKYDEYQPLWVFFLESYLGGAKYVAKHLFRYFKEGEKEFEGRQLRAYRENHTKRVADLINSYLFKEEASRKTENARIEKFWKNFDGKGRGINQFMKRASLFASIVGRVYIVQDKPELADNEKTGTQMDNLKPEAMPYCYIVYPQDVLDIAFDDRGKPKWALIHEYKRDDDDPFESSCEVKEYFRLWLPNEWVLFNDRGEIEDQGETNLGRVPIVRLDSEDQDEYTGQSLIGDIAYLDRSIMNNWSRLDTIVCDQTFSQLIFPVEGLPADIVDDEKLREKFMTLATNRILLYSAQAQAAPEFISPDASQAMFILNMIKTQVKQLYASIGLQAETATEIKEQSGLAKSYDFEKLNKLLASKADNLQEAEYELVELFKLWMGGISGEAEVDYPDEFDTRSLADEIAMAHELTILGISETFTKELHKQIASKVLPKLDSDLVKKINKEIDDKDLLQEEAIKQGLFDFDKKKALPTPKAGDPGSRQKPIPDNQKTANKNRQSQKES